MALNTTNGAPILTPEQVDSLLVRPMFAASVAAQVGRVVQTDSKTFRIPIVTADPSAAWVAEGAEITPSDPTLVEIDVSPAKLAGLTIVTRELAEDSSEEAQAEVGSGLARDLARKMDQAFFSSVAAPAPDGLADLVGFTAVDAGSAWDSLDPFEEAAADVEDEHANVTAWVGGSAAVLALAGLKKATGSNESLLAPDPTQPARRILVGRPLFKSPYVPANTIYGVSQDRAVIVVRRGARIETDASVFFTSDRIAVKGTMRVGFGFPHPAAIAKVTITP